MLLPSAILDGYVPSNLLPKSACGCMGMYLFVQIHLDLLSLSFTVS